MPIYEYQCQTCGRVTEALITRTEYEDGYSPRCVECAKVEPFRTQMVRVLSTPAPPQFGGIEGKLRSGEKLRSRNDAYHRSAKGRDEHKANIEAARKRGLPA